MDLQSQKKQALLTSLRLLTATAKSRSELSKRLLDKGYHPDVVAETLTELERQGILNDQAYAQNLKARYQYAKPSGKRRIDFELKKRGIGASVREKILDDVTPEEEQSRALELAEQRWSRLQKLPADKRKKRIYDFLIRRGFSFETVKDVVTALERSLKNES